MLPEKCEKLRALPLPIIFPGSGVSSDEGEGSGIGKGLDLFLLREVRGAVEQVLSVSLVNGISG